MTKRLYHYTSAQSLLYILEGGSIWSSKIQYMNDSKEFSHAIDIANRYISRYKTKNSDKVSSNIGNKISEILERISNMNIFVACFSEVPDSLGQWRGYCPPSLGYCIGFNSEELEAQAMEQGFLLHRCIYDVAEKERVVSHWVTALIKTLSKAYTSEQDLEAFFWQHGRAYVDEFIGIASVMKHEAFSDEKEWRLISMVSSDNQRMGLRVGKSMLIPYVPIALNYSKDKCLLWNLTVGPTPQIDQAMSSASMLVRNAWFENGITRSMIPFRDW